MADDVADADAEAEAAVDWHAFVPTDTADHLATMDRAARESGCGVPWQLLAAIARVESDFGRNMATSSAGAIGYGQFLPSSWQVFGSEGNAYDYRDALPAIALYLCKFGLARDPRSALFAYNHADWYVDLVLDLAVRYDRMAPGAPIPEVLGVGPPTEAGQPIHYARGRDVRLDSRARVVDATATWLGVPWRGRRPGAAISVSALESTTLEMLRGAFGLTGGLPEGTSTDESQDFADLADRAWQAGLLAEPDDTRSWTIDAIRLHLLHGHPVVALLDPRALPGHPATEAVGVQPVVVLGMTADGLIYSDPSFSSSLGYGLELSNTNFLASWQSARSWRRALAFTPRPRPPARQAHVRAAEPPAMIPRITATPTPTPSPTFGVPSTQPALATPVVPPVVAAAVETRVPAVALGADNRGAGGSRTARTGQDDADITSMFLVAGAVVAAAWVRLRRARPS
jgi:hypothetical protein